MNLLYIVGEPGVGKSALMAELIKGRRRLVRQKPFAHTRYEGGLVQLGRERGNGFSGTDALSMSVQPQVVGKLSTRVWKNIVGEGDRLANPKFFASAQNIGYDLTVVLLEAPEDVLAARRLQRGSEQNDSWLQGRKTKVQNLAPWVNMRLDATLPLFALARELSDHPVFNGAVNGTQELHRD